MGTAVTRPDRVRRASDANADADADADAHGDDDSGVVTQPRAVIAKDIAALAAISTPAEDAYKRRAYAHLRSSVVARRASNAAAAAPPSSRPCNLIEDIYNEDFDHIDHAQALRFPPTVAQQLRAVVRNEAERRCAEAEKTMARCLQDKMWTSWKCQKLRDVYYQCVRDEEQRNVQPSPELLASGFVDLLTAYRWKYTLGVFHGEVQGRNRYMRHVWQEHFPDTPLPHPWVQDT